jgi:methanogenic corrinoid protein MtbC1
MQWTVPRSGARRVVVTTPEGQLHEFGALVGALLCASRGFEPVYLGPSLPEADIRLAIDQSRAELLVLSVARDATSAERAALSALLRRLAERVETWVGLPEGHALVGARTGVRLFHRYEEFDMALTQLGVAGHP